MAVGYGTDIWAAESLFTGRLARGKNLVAQACYRRLITPRGMLRGGPEEENYGLDLPGLVGRPNPARTAAMLPGMIRGELLKDDRIADVDVAVTYAQDLSGMATFNIKMTVLTYDESESFDLTLEVSAASTKLVGLE